MNKPRGRPPNGTAWDEVSGRYVYRIPRGRPPNGTAWDEVSGRYVYRKPCGRPPNGTVWDQVQGIYIANELVQVSDTLFIRGVSDDSSGGTSNSEEMNGCVLADGIRQNPCHECTREQRGNDGQYKEEVHHTKRRRVAEQNHAAEQPQEQMQVEQNHANKFKNSFYEWYETKTDEECAWLNTNPRAQMMMSLALRSFDSILEMNMMAR